MRSVRSLLLITALMLALAEPGALESCGPFKQMAGFVNPEEPDSLSGFLHGQLQIVRPGLRRKYLFVVYRYLSGKPLSTAEMQALQKAWEPAPVEDSQQLESTQGATPDLRAWLKERAQVPGAVPVSIDPQRPLGEFQSFVNCTDSAFASAARTLRQRMNEFGAQSREVQLWLEGQDNVFVNCGGKVAVPRALAADIATLIKADREYQIGAAHFYSGDWEQAREQFQRVAADRTSPWRNIAAIVAARALVRKATLKPPQDKSFDAETMASAEAELKQTLADKDMASVHSYARQILGFVEFRLHPQQRSAELDRELSGGKESPQDLSQNLTDYLLLRGAEDSEMSHWIRQMSVALDQRGSPRKSWSEASLQAWKQNKDIPWLLAALSGAESTDAGAAELVLAAKSVPENSPAYLTIRYHLLRLMAEAGNPAEVYAAVSDLLQKRKAALTPSTVNALLEMKLRTAPDLESFVANLPRHPVIETWGDGNVPCGPGGKPNRNSLCSSVFLDREGALLVNHLPLGVFSAVARNAHLPQSLRTNLLKAIWTKAVLLGDENAAGAVTPDLMTSVPESSSLLGAYLNAKDATSKNQAALFLLLHFPGFVPYIAPGERRATAPDHIDVLRENWWCYGGVRSDYWTFEIEPATTPDGQTAGPPLPLAAFLSPAEKQQAETENATFRTLATAPNYFVSNVLRWAEKSPDDPRLPEALHFAVRSTRFGCTDKATKALSKQAFELLHRRFPQSPWTQKTPYYFGQ